MREGFKPEKHKQKVKEKESEKGLSRRSFLFGGAAALGAAAIPKRGEAMESNHAKKVDASKLAPHQEKVKNLMLKIRFAQERLKKPEVARALEGRGPRSLKTVLDAAHLSISPDELEGTMYDVSKLHDRSVQIQYHRELQHTVVPSSSREPFLTSKEGGYGNGVLWEDQNRILTTAHIAKSLKGETEGVPEDGVDIGFVKLGRSLESKNVIHDDPSLHDEDIHGEFVAIVGIDPDATADQRTGRKTWIGMAVDMSRGLYETPQLAKERPPRLTRAMASSFSVLIPPGESEPDEKGIIPAFGMSGAPMYVWKRGRWTFAGIFWGTVKTDVDGTSVNLANVHGIDVIRKKKESAEVATLS